MIKFDEVKDFAQKHFTSRKDRYIGAHKYFKEVLGIDLEPNTFKDIDTFLRYFRDNEVFSADEIGIKKEKEWEKSGWMHQWETETRNNLDKLSITSKKLEHDKLFFA